MEIKILHLIEGAGQAEGLTVVIDVFRAFSLACYFTDQGAEKIIPVGNIDDAYLLKKENNEYILAGERFNKKMPGFDFGNSPFHIQGIDFTGKTIVHTTSAGTQGIVNAKNASEIITGSFVNAGAIIKYIRKQNSEKVSLVCMGYSAIRPTEEDTFCAEYIRNGVEEKTSDFTAMKENIRLTAGNRFFNPEEQNDCPSEDYDLCLDLNRFNFVLRAEKSPSGLIYLKKIVID